MKRNPCEICGACCAFFCVSFPDTETDDIIDGVVPLDMTFLSKKNLRSMRGTETSNPRCIALEGKVGVNVKCLIYKDRPSTCHNFCLSWENNIGNSLCDKARSFFGLQPFSQY